MADMLNAPLPQALPRSTRSSAWAPLRQPLFQSLWGAAVISYIGTWMQNVGAGWLMTQLTASPLMVSLVQAASTLPVLIVMLPAGALADLVDRRRFLLITQTWMVLAAGALGLLTLSGMITPWLILALTFAMGLGAVMNDPAWQAITPELVPPEQHAAAVALNSVGFNVARAIGPVLGGLVIAATNSGIAFLLNAASFFGVIAFLYHWKRPFSHRSSRLAVWDSIAEGRRYCFRSTLVRGVLIRTACFSLAASSLLALLPILAQRHGPGGYGMLLGAFGIGALAGAAVLPHLRQRFSVDTVVAVAIVVFAAMTSVSGYVRHFDLLLWVLFSAGVAWIGILACLNIVAQTMSPPGLRARALSFYLLALQGGMALGSAFWGALANRIGIPSALAYSGLALVVGLLPILKYRLTADELEFAPSVIRD
jgi:MFS family permease